MISGGALSQCAVFAIGVTAYINASIIMQLLTVAIPKLEEISKRNIVAKEWIEHYYNLKKVLHNIKQTQTISKDDEDTFDDEV